MARTLEQWLDYQQNLHPQEIDLGLARVNGVYQRLLQNPAYTLNCPKILVAGTNGKGSTATMLALLYQQAGFKVGKFTSPHLFSYNERIEIGAKTVSDADLIQAFEEIEAARNRDAPISLSYFEFSTLAALVLFAQHQIDVAVLEVGLGGRLDAGNIIDADAAIITSISRDHEAYLGSDLEHIGTEKAHIFRANKMAIYGGAPLKSIPAHARQIGSHYYQRGQDFDLRGTRLNAADETLIYQRANVQIPIQNPHFNAPEFYQNLSCALAAVDLLSPLLKVDLATASSALKDFAMTGRMQYLTCDAMDLLLDVGHNPAACALISRAVAEKYPRDKVKIILGMMADKDISACLAALKNLSGQFYCVNLPLERAIANTALADLIQAQLHPETITICENVSQALKVVKADYRQGELVVVMGSFYTVAGAGDFIQNHRAKRV